MKMRDLLKIAHEFWARASVIANWVERHRWARRIINGLVILFVLVFVFSYVAKDWRMLSRLEIKIHPNQIVFSVLAYGANFLLMAQIWHFLVRMIGASVPWREDYELYSYSNLSRFLPTPVWYLASRTALYERKYGLSKRKTLLLTFFETFLHFVSGITVFTILRFRIVSPITWLYLLGLVPMVLVILYPKQILQFLMNVKDGEIFTSTAQMAGIFVLYKVTWAVSFLFFRFIIQITSQSTLTNASLLEIWVISTLVSYVSTYTLGGAGMFREFSLALLLSPSLTPPVAIIVSIMVRVMMMVAGVAWSLLVSGCVKLSIGFNVLRKKEHL